MWLSRISVNRPVFTTMVVSVLMILGFIGLFRLPVDLFPEVSMPVITVIVPFPGAGPVQVEEELVKPIEDAVAGLQGLSEIYGTARENVAVVAVVFEMGTPVDQVAAELRDRVYGLKISLPDGVEDPIFRRIDPAAVPVMTLAMASDLDPQATLEIAEREVKPRLERIEGVGAVEIKGGEQREIHIELDLAKMAELRIPMMQVVQQVGFDTVDIPGGHIELGEARVGLRAPGAVQDLDELGAIVVQGFPSPIYLRDIARIVDATAEQDAVSRVDGRRAVTLEVIKESGANTVAVCDQVREEAAELKLPGGVTVQAVIDTSTMAKDMLREMQRALVIGAAMAVLVVYLFMVDWRSTVISATALPTSVITTFFFMWLFGFSLNILSLIAMALAIGVLIDDAVVVREVIYRHLEQGEGPVEAALKGTSEVALAVLATTLSILAVFVPVGFMQGIVGQFFAQFGLTVAIAVAVSLFIAFTVDPMLSARMSRVVRPEERGRAGRGLVAFWHRVDDHYKELLAWALAHPRGVLAAAVVLFGLSLGMVAVTGAEFIPHYDRSQLMVDVDLAPSTALLPAEKVAEQIEARLRAVPEVEHIYAAVGKEGSTDHIELRVTTTPKEERARSIDAIQEHVRALLADIPGATIGVRDPPLIEGAKMGTDIDVEIRGDDIAALQDVADRVRMGIGAIPGAVNVQSSYRPGRPELQLHVDRDKAGSAGLSVGQAGLTLRMAVAGQVVGTFREGGRSHDIRLMARSEDRTPEALASNLLLLSPIPRVTDPYGRGTPVALGNVARLGWETAPSVISRHDRQRHLTVSCAVKDRPLSDVVGEVKVMLASLGAPEGVDTEIQGMADVAGDALLDLLFALGLAIVFVYAVLASQYESFIHPFTIMLSLPLAVVGAFATVFLMGWSIGILTMLGIILLMGLVTKNAILLVDRANQLLGDGLDPREAMLRAGHARLRPILMTSLAMILGMLPPALSNGSGSEIFKPMAVPVIGGLVASTLLTLVVVPVVWLLVEGLRRRLRARHTAEVSP
ncbi:MAG: efflux RND transporter permease subunit [Pseudomonadota bacterium]